MSLVMTDAVSEVVTGGTVGRKCQRCTTCSCDLKPDHPRPKSTMEEYSEVETSSSGFSDGESRICNKFTQTDDKDKEYVEIAEEATTPTPVVSNKCLDLASPMNPCDNRFQTTPEYK